MGKHGLTLAVSVLLATGAVNAAEEDLVKYRQNLMKSISGNMSNIVAIIKGEVPYGDNIALHAEQLAALAPLALPAFETEAMSDKTEALPEIWENWDEFEQSALTFEEKSLAFSEAVKGGDRARIGPALGELGDSCKGCHDDFSEDH